MLGAPGLAVWWVRCCFGPVSNRAHGQRRHAPPPWCAVAFDAYRRVRDTIRAVIEELPQRLAL